MSQNEAEQTDTNTDANDNDSVEKSVYKPSILPLPGYVSNHGPFSGSPEQQEASVNPQQNVTPDYLPRSFIGRKDIIESLVALLNENSGKRGTYLIAGYRGVGKTSVINIAVSKYKKDQTSKAESCKTNPPKIQELFFNLSESKHLTPIDIYHSITSLLLKSLHEDNYEKKIDGYTEFFFKSIIFSAIICFLFIGIFHLFTASNSFLSLLSENFLLIFTPLTAFIFSLFAIAQKHTSRDYTLRGQLTRLENLVARISNEVSSSKGIQQRSTGFLFTENKKSLPVQIREVEDTLKDVLEVLNIKHNYEFIFVIDEIDKISSTDVDDSGQSEINHVTKLLGNLKSFLTSANSRFFFISGRETLDSYYSEKGSANSLYLSLFDKVYEVPSLLTDTGGRLPKSTQVASLIEEYVCSRLFPSNDQQQPSLRNYYSYIQQTQFCNSLGEAKQLVVLVRHFINYLTFHSWGNPKRLSSLLENYIIPLETLQRMYPDSPIDKNCQFYLLFDINDKRSFSLASELTTLFQHQLSREVTKTSDKLTISTFSSLHFILKFHPYGFTRESLHRMSEAISTFRSPVLNTIIDDLLTQVLKPYIRRIRNGSFRYRFHSGFEQEIRYVSHISELESATYNFSLDSMRKVKAFFKNDIDGNKNQNSIHVVKSLLALGDLSLIEQSLSSASIHYTSATEKLSKLTLESINSHQTNPEIVMLYIEAMLKHGDLEKRRQNYNYAAAIYTTAMELLNKYCHSLDQNKKNSVLTQNINSTEISAILDNSEDHIAAIRSGDSKWDILKQPYWALQFLALKRSPPSNALPKLPEYLYSQNSYDIRCNYKLATLHLFLGNTDTPSEYFLRTLNQCIESNPLYDRRTESNSNFDWKDRFERNAYIGGNCLTGLAESALINQAIIAINQLRDKTSNTSVGSKNPIVETINQLFTSSLQRLIADSNNLYSQHLSTLIPNATILTTIENAGEYFQENRLYVSATVAYLKLISYHCCPTFLKPSHLNLAWIKFGWRWFLS